MDNHPVIRAERIDTVALNAVYRHGPPSRYQACVLYLITPPLPGLDEGEKHSKVTEVTWTIEGRDQGYAGEQPGTYQQSGSWYEACIFRHRSGGDGWIDSRTDVLEELQSHEYPAPADVLLQQSRDWDLVEHGDSIRWHVQYNLVAYSAFKRYVVKWQAGGKMDAADADEKGYGIGAGFLDALQPGDRVGLWARAERSGWRNVIREAEVKLKYEVQ